MTVLVIDAGTSSVRAVAVAVDGTVVAEEHALLPPTTPSPGLVELDATATVTTALALAVAVAERVGPLDAVGVADQRASVVAWDARTGDPVGPGIGWQDLRTVGRCLELRAEGIPVAPNHSATKVEWLLANAGVPTRHLRVGTIDSWIAWHLTAGAVHVTDASNASVTGLFDGTGWDAAVLDRLGIPAEVLPGVVDTFGFLGTATALPGAPPLTALVGDQQASLAGQGCVEPGQAKITFGTGGMLDLCVGREAGPAPARGTFPIVAWRSQGEDTFAREAVMLSAGTAIDWLCDGLGLVDDVADTDALAASVEDTGGVVFVPAMHGLGTPVWDHGARGLLIGCTRGTTRAQVVRAVLEGVAQRGADLVDATERDTGQRIEMLRVDGGMSANGTFVQALADATGHTVEVSAEREATALGAAFLAGVGAGTWASVADAVARREAPRTVVPAEHADRGRARFAEARARAERWIPALSELDL